MKKPGMTRYNLDKVYFLTEYNKAVAYGKQNIGIQGVKEQLQGLEQEKKSYFEKVANIVSPERDTEQAKYQQYEKWAIMEKKCKWAEIMLIVLLVVQLSTFRYLPLAFKTSLLFSLFNVLLVLLVLFAGPVAFIIAKIARYSFALRYNKYVIPLSNQINSLGSSFTRTSLRYYDAIDSLYLSTLDPAHREMILLRRQQEMHNQDMLRLERARQKAEEQRLKEQQRTRQATEELLAIEKERERRYRRW